MNTWTCQCGEMNAGALAKCRCGRLREPAQTVSEVTPKMSANNSESTRSSRKATTPEERLNKTERAFLEYLRSVFPKTDQIGIQSLTFRIGWDLRYTPDFVVATGCVVHCYEVKGFMRDDARVKLLATAAATWVRHWATFSLVKRDKSQPSGWLITEVQR